MKRHSGFGVRLLYSMLGVCVFYSGFLLYRQRVVTTWSPATATVHTISHTHSGEPSAESRSPYAMFRRAISYSFDVDGSTYHGKRLNPSPILIYGGDIKHEEWDKISNWRRKAIRYNPKKPDESYFFDLGFSAFPTGLFVASLIALFAAIHFEQTNRRYS